MAARTRSVLLAALAVLAASLIAAPPPAAGCGCPIFDPCHVNNQLHTGQTSEARRELDTPDCVN